MKDLAKPKYKPAKPRSTLQLANGQVQWAINFRLRNGIIRQCDLRDVNLSFKTCDLINKHNQLSSTVEESIRADYQAQKEAILRERKKVLDDFDRHDNINSQVKQ